MGNFVGSTEPSNETDNIELRIYEIVEKLYPEDCEKITGMLLEVDQDELKELLENREELNSRIERAAMVVRQNREEQSTSNGIKDDVSKAGDDQEKEQEKEQLGCQIFLKVVNQYPSTADKITGMLLEMDIAHLHEINNDNDLLMERVSQAVQVLGEEEKSYDSDDGEDMLAAPKKQNKELFLRHIDSELNISSLKKQFAGLEENMQRDVIGEELYKILFKIYPNYADKITGMLLEMNTNNLLETLENTELLQNRVEQAMEALSGKS